MKTNGWELSQLSDAPGKETWLISGFVDIPGWLSPQVFMLAKIYSLKEIAKLIAAAPEMLEALLYVRDRVKSGQEFGMSKILSAIKKAQP